MTACRVPNCSCGANWPDDTECEYPKVEPHERFYAHKRDIARGTEALKSAALKVPVNVMPQKRAGTCRGRAGGDPVGCVLPFMLFVIVVGALVSLSV